ncbi:MAG: hypothetical protein ABL982_00190 [Vicinamibacterales bacterium]
MSAYVVHPDTVDYIVSAAEKFSARFHSPLRLDAGPHALATTSVLEAMNTFPLFAKTNAELVGKILWAANLESVAYHYNELKGGEAYLFTRVRYDEIDPVDVLASIACLRYQSCEFYNYHDSFAARILDTIERDAIRALPGYDDAPWGWTRGQVSKIKVVK